jgi:hypothetical protein
MFLSGVLFVLFLAGCLGALAWVIVRYGYRPARSIDALLATEVALARHPASRARQADSSVQALPIGPDDDPEFLHRLAERIRGAE